MKDAIVLIFENGEKKTLTLDEMFRYHDKPLDDKIFIFYSYDKIWKVESHTLKTIKCQQTKVEYSGGVKYLVSITCLEIAEKGISPESIKKLSDIWKRKLNDNKR